MKKIIIFLTLFVLVISCVTPLTSAVTVENFNDFQYDVVSDEITITGYTGNATEVKIPSTIDGYPVKRIGNRAFSYCYNITSITIPNSVTSIGEGAFYKCTSLESITLPFIGSSRNENGTSNAVFGYIFGFGDDGTMQKFCESGSATYLHSYCIPSSLKYVTITDATQIPYGAFSNCTGLTKITILDGVKNIGKRAFDNCDGLTSITIPNSVTSMGDSAFSSCGSLTSITIPNSVTSMGDSAFSYCGSLTSITIPDSVTSMGNSAFFGCDNLTEVTIGNGVTSIDSYAFYNCSNLKRITLPFVGQNSDGTGFSNFGYIFGANSNSYPQYDNKKYVPSSLKEVVITGSNSIASDAFYECVGLTDIHIIGDVRVIGGWAFGYCSGLKNISIPSSCKTISSMAFYDCVNLENVYFLGSKSQNSMTVQHGNEMFEDVATWHYNSCIGDTNHKYNSGKVTKIATCKVTGVKTYTCTICKKTKTETIAKTNAHTYSKATCTKPKTCKVCGETSGKALGHSYNSGKVTNKATCKSTGIKTYTCKVCKKTKTSTIAKSKKHTYTNACDKTCNVCKSTRKTTHKYDSGKVTKKATCKSTGIKTYTCKVCKKTKTSTIAKLKKHTYTNACDKTCNVCKAKRKTSHKFTNACDKTCNICNATRKIKHKYSNSCDSACNICKAKRTVSHKYSNSKDKTCNLCKKVRCIHKYKTKTVKATTSKNGYVLTECTYCGKDKSKTTVYAIKSVKLSKTNYVYDGKIKTPSVIVKNSKGKTIPKKYYTISYQSGRKRVGKYKVDIKFKGKYSGRKTLYFKINAKIDEEKFLKYCTYKVSNGEVTIVGVEQSIQGKVVIPTKIKGYPVTEIGSNAFLNCHSVTSVSIPIYVKQISFNSFDCCSNLVNINVSAKNKYYTSVDGVLFNKSKSVLIWYPNGKTDKKYIIPDGVKKITTRAFENPCAWVKRPLTSIVIPDSVVEIEGCAFEFCDSLKNIYYKGSKSQKSKIDIGVANDYLLSAKWHYNS